MANTIKLKRGLSSNVSSLTLQPGEVAIVLDAGILKYGDQNGAVKDLIVSTAANATKANTAAALEKTILINGIEFNGTADIDVPTLIEAGDHVSIESDKVIHVLDIGSLTELSTEDKSTVVKAINEVVASNKTIDNKVVVLKTDVESQIAQLNKKISQINTDIAQFSVEQLINDMLSITETAGIQVGNASSKIQTSIDDKQVKIYSGNREYLGVKTNTTTGEVQTFCETLNAKSVISGVHERKTFTINGQKRTGFFYFEGGNN